MSNFVNKLMGLSTKCTLDKICQNTGRRKPVFLHILQSDTVSGFIGYFLNKIESNMVTTLKPILHKRIVDKTYQRKKKNEANGLLDKMISYNSSIRSAPGVNSNKFLDTKATPSVSLQQGKIQACI